MSVVFRRVHVLLVAGLGPTLALLATPASAHTELVGGSPGPGEVLRTPVSAVTLTFASDLLAEGSQVLVRDSQGADRAGATVVTGAAVRVPVKPLRTAGRYTVAYRAVAVDGHPITGSYRFTVSPAAASAAANVTDPGAEPAAGSGTEDAVDSSDAPSTTVAAPSTPTWVIGVLGAGTLAALLWIGAGRRSARHETKKR
ncbi:MAG: copper resistance protein CopC [Nocardioidaceae bacterium]